MIEKPKQYLDTRSHQLYYQWDESEYFSHQEPIYDRTREYIESLEAENAKLRELVRDMMRYYFMPSAIDRKQRETELLSRAHELGVEEDNGELVAEVDDAG